jgi:hypothetical protein
MVLKAEVVDLRGRLLIAAGKELTERSISALPMWGVEAVDVEGDDAPPEAEDLIDAATLERARQEIDARFANAFEDHPLLNMLREECALALAREIVMREREAAA